MAKILTPKINFVLNVKNRDFLVEKHRFLRLKIHASMAQFFSAVGGTLIFL